MQKAAKHSATPWGVASWVWEHRGSWQRLGFTASSSWGALTPTPSVPWPYPLSYHRLLLTRRALAGLHWLGFRPPIHCCFRGAPACSVPPSQHLVPRAPPPWQGHVYSCGSLLRVRSHVRGTLRAARAWVCVPTPPPATQHGISRHRPGEKGGRESKRPRAQHVPRPWGLREQDASGSLGQHG